MPHNHCVQMKPTVEQKRVLLTLLDRGEQNAASLRMSFLDMELMRRKKWVSMRDGSGISKHRPAEKVLYRATAVGATLLVKSI